MSWKMSNNESSIENVSIKHRPVKVHQQDIHRVEEHSKARSRKHQDQYQHGNQHGESGNSKAEGQQQHPQVQSPNAAGNQQVIQQGRDIVILPEIHQIDQCVITHYTVDQVLGIKQTYSNAIHDLLEQDLKRKEKNDLLQTNLQVAIEQIQNWKIENKDLSNR